MITATLTLAYLVWVNVIAFYGGFWVYPVFKVTFHCCDTSVIQQFMKLGL